MAELRHKGTFIERFQDSHGGLQGAQQWIMDRLSKGQGDREEDWSAEEDRRFHLRHLGSLVDTANTHEELVASRDARIEQMANMPSARGPRSSSNPEDWTIEDSQAS